MAERGRGPGAFTVACGAERAVVQAWHDEQRVERDRYAGLLALQPAEVVTSDVSVSALPGRAARREISRGRGVRQRDDDQFA